VTLAGEAEALQRVDSGREKYVRLGAARRRTRPKTIATGDDPVRTGKIAWAHLKEIRDDATRLDRLEAKAERKA